MVSEQEIKVLFENSKDAVVYLEKTGKILQVNKKAAEFYGGSEKDFVGKHFTKIGLKIKNFSSVLKHFVSAVAGKKSHVEVCLTNRKGKTIWIEASVTPIKNSNKILVIGREITERKDALEALQSSEAKLKILFEYAPDGYYLSDTKGNFIDGNKAAEKIVGYKREELIGKSFLKLNILPKSQIPKAAASLAKNLLGKPTGPDEFTLIRKNGEKRYVEVSTFPTVINGKKVSLGIARDITDKKTVKQKISEEKEKYKSLFDNMIDGFAFHKILVDNKGKPVDYVFLEANEAFEKLTGLIRKDIIGKKVTEAIPGIEKDPADWIGKYGNIALKGGEIRFEQFAEPLNKWFAVSAYSPSKGFFVTIFEDITSRKNSEKALKESEEKTRSIIEQSRDGIMLVDEDFKIIEWNKGQEEIFGYSKQEMLGKFLWDYQFETMPEKTRTKEEMKKILLLLKKGNHNSEAMNSAIEYTVKTKRGKIKSVEVIASPIIAGKRFLYGSITRDITEKKKVQRDKEKLQDELKKYAKRLEIKVKKLEKNKIDLTDNEKQVLYAITAYPELNDRELSLKTGIKRSTITAIRNKLHKDNVCNTYYLPNFHAIGSQVLIIAHGKFSKKFEQRKKYLHELLLPEFIYTNSTDEDFIILGAGKNMIEVHKKSEGIIEFGTKNKIFEERPVINSIIFELTRFDRFFDFAPFLNHLLELDNPERENKHVESKIKLNKNSKKILYAFVKYPNATSTEIAKILRFSRATVKNNEKLLVENGYLRRAVIPNLKKLKCEIIALIHTQERKRLEVQNPHTICKIKNGNDNFELRVYKEYSHYTDDLDELSKMYHVQDSFFKEPTIIVTPLNKLKISKINFAGITKKLLGIEEDI